MQRRMRLVLLIPLLVVFALAACGDDDDDGGGDSAGACPGGSVEIAMVDIKFDPEDATAQVGQEICWVNEDSIDHNAVAESGADFESDLFGQGQTFTATVEEAGTVEYVCTVHPGMTGTIEVTE
jgi:plastocyanin